MAKAREPKVFRSMDDLPLMLTPCTESRRLGVWVSLPGLKRSRKTGGYKAGMCRLRYRMGSVRGNLQRRKFMSGLRWYEPQGSDQKRYVF